jgi:hypothetical protein
MLRTHYWEVVDRETAERRRGTGALGLTDVSRDVPILRPAAHRDPPAADF